MKAFIWTILIIFCVEMLGKIIWLVQGFPERTKAGIAVDLIFAIGFICWALWLIASVV